MQKRDDLPEMTLPLALLLILVSAAFSLAGAKLLSSAVLSGAMVHLIASIVFLPAAACAYSLVILLWRRYASLLVTPISFAAMMFFGADAFSSVVISLTVLLSAYTFAVSMISRESKFHRLTSLAVAISLCALLSAIGYIGLYYKTFDSFLTFAMDSLSELANRVFSAYGVLQPDMAYRTAAREIIVMLPAYMGIAAIVLSAITDILTKAAFKLLNCENIFIELTVKITMPRAYAAVFLISLVLFGLTSAIYNPLIYTMLKSVTYVMILPCALVGISSGLHMHDDEYFYMNGRRITTIVIMLLILLTLGLKAALTVYAACGAVRVIKSGGKAKRSEQ